MIRHANLSRPGIRRRTGSSCLRMRARTASRSRPGPSRSARSALAPSARSLAPGGKARPPTRPIGSATVQGFCTPLSRANCRRQVGVLSPALKSRRARARRLRLRQRLLRSARPRAARLSRHRRAACRVLHCDVATPACLRRCQVDMLKEVRRSTSQIRRPPKNRFWACQGSFSGTKCWALAPASPDSADASFASAFFLVCFLVPAMATSVGSLAA